MFTFHIVRKTWQTTENTYNIRTSILLVQYFLLQLLTPVSFWLWPLSVLFRLSGAAECCVDLKRNLGFWTRFAGFKFGYLCKKHYKLSDILFLVVFTKTIIWIVPTMLANSSSRHFSSVQVWLVFFVTGRISKTMASIRSSFVPQTNPMSDLLEPYRSNASPHHH